MVDDNLTAVGQLSAAERMSSMIVGLYKRAQGLGLVEDDAFEFPLRREHLADALGLSLVHTIKTWSALRKAGLFEQRGSRLRLLNPRINARLATVLRTGGPLAADSLRANPQKKIRSGRQPERILYSTAASGRSRSFGAALAHETVELLAVLGLADAVKPVGEFAMRVFKAAALLFETGGLGALPGVESRIAGGVVKPCAHDGWRPGADARLALAWNPFIADRAPLTRAGRDGLQVRSAGLALPILQAEDREPERPEDREAKDRRDKLERRQSAARAYARRGDPEPSALPLSNAPCVLLIESLPENRPEAGAPVGA